jgi:pyruvate/2-oxoacid:ferredoxin oxidoreductase beta subunit/Pyruvate/2-oxoacid:ferredoxin oxidoreductase delta subunit
MNQSTVTDPNTPGVESDVDNVDCPPLAPDQDLFALSPTEYEAEFNRRIADAQAKNPGTVELAADASMARSLVPPATAALRNFSYVGAEIPEVIEGACIGCMECVTQCPDTAILAKVTLPQTLEAMLGRIEGDDEKERLRKRWARTNKYFDVVEKRGEEPGLFGLFVDPSKCKGCGECVTACGDHHALRMVPKRSATMALMRREFEFFASMPPTPTHFIRDKVLADMMLTEDRALLYTGGAGSCPGCGEATALRMMLAATGFVHGPQNVGIIAATGCNTVFGSTYPFNPFKLSWTNSLFENAVAVAMGVRLRWDQIGWEKKRLWVVGGDGALYDIGFGALSRMLASGYDIKVLVLDTQVYSNTGGQASTSTFTAQAAKMAPFGRTVPGKLEHRKELAVLAMMHPETFVAQTSCAHVNHFYRAVMDANAYPGPAVINVYTTCQPEHGVGDERSVVQAKLAVESRAHPLFVHDPRKGEKLSERLSLQGNPNATGDWKIDRKNGRPVTFIDFAQTEARFARQFDADGNPSETLLRAEAERLQSWRRLQELAGIR